MTDFLISGRDYLARSPGFALLGRDNELAKLCSILVRKHASSVLLVAPSGVGATSLCMGLQTLKSRDDAPFDIMSKTIFWLDGDALFATGEGNGIDKAFRAALDRLRRSVEPILIIEDAGDFLDACRNSGSVHFINLLNGLVREGRLQVILEVSDSDVDKVLKWHSDIRESYTLMDVPEPTGECLAEIVGAAASKLSEYHEIQISDEAIRTSIELTEKYRAASPTSGAQPKRSINLLDRAMASYRLSAHSMPPAARPLKGRIDAGTATDGERADYAAIMERHAHRQADLKKFHADQRAAEEAILTLEVSLADARAAADARQAESGERSFASMTGAGGGFASREVQQIADNLSMFRRQLADHLAGYESVAAEINAELMLDRTAVLHEFSRISGISVSKLGEDELLILRALEGTLKTSVFGQDHAVEALANAVKVARVGRRNKDRPQASFLLLGPSGVGKTEIAKQLARALLGDAKALTRFDMSEYMERHAASKLIGAPPGYEGFEAGGILTNAMRTNRNRVLLFDEAEKAHPDVFNLFLQILDDGRLTDNIGRVAEFSDAIVILTSNIGQSHFLNDELGPEEQMMAAMADLEATFRPEFLNRFNGRENIIGFRKLDLPVIGRIVRREVDDLAASYAAHGVDVRVSDEVIGTFAADRYDPVIGARGLPGFINSNLEPRIVNALLDRSAVAGARFDVGYDTIGKCFTIGGEDAGAAASAA